MEYTQWVSTVLLPKYTSCLNPCCNGIYSMSAYECMALCVMLNVLILVVMEYTQWAFAIWGRCRTHVVLILVVMEYTQWALSSMIFQ